MEGKLSKNKSFSGQLTNETTISSQVYVGRLSAPMGFRGTLSKQNVLTGKLGNQEGE